MSRDYPSQGEIYSGRYTPILTEVTDPSNNTILTLEYMYFLKVGDIVSCHGSIICNPIATGTVDIEMTLPVDTSVDITSGQISGTVVHSSSATIGAVIPYTTNTALLSFESNTASSLRLLINFQYVVK